MLYKLVTITILLLIALISSKKKKLRQDDRICKVACVTTDENYIHGEEEIEIDEIKKGVYLIGYLESDESHGVIDGEVCTFERDIHDYNEECADEFENTCTDFNCYAEGVEISEEDYQNHDY